MTHVGHPVYVSCCTRAKIVARASLHHLFSACDSKPCVHNTGLEYLYIFLTVHPTPRGQVSTPGSTESNGPDGHLQRLLFVFLQQLIIYSSSAIQQHASSPRQPAPGSEPNLVTCKTKGSTQADPLSSCKIYTPMTKEL